MRTLRVLRPRSFRLLFFSFPVPLAALGGVLACTQAPMTRAAWALLLTVALARLGQHLVSRRSAGLPLLADLWLLPLRDALLCFGWCRSFLNSPLSWRGIEFNVDADGIMRAPDVTAGSAHP